LRFELVEPLEVAHEALRRLIAVVRVLRQELADDPSEHGRDLRPELRDFGRLADGVQADELAYGRRRERRLPDERLEEYGTQRVQVRALVDRALQHPTLLGRAVGPATDGVDLLYGLARHLLGRELHRQ